MAGVANVILKRDYSGITTTARFGQATDGGDAQQQYSVVAGTRWDGGGVIGTFEHLQSTAIFSSQLRVPARRGVRQKLSGDDAALCVLPLSRNADSLFGDFVRGRDRKLRRC